MYKKMLMYFDVYQNLSMVVNADWNEILMLCIIIF